MFPSCHGQINVCAQANKQVTWRGWVCDTSTFYFSDFCLSKKFSPIVSALCGSVVRTLILSVTSQSRQQMKQSNVPLPAIVLQIKWNRNPVTIYLLSFTVVSFGLHTTGTLSCCTVRHLMRRLNKNLPVLSDQHKINCITGNLPGDWRRSKRGIFIGQY